MPARMSGKGGKGFGQGFDKGFGKRGKSFSKRLGQSSGMGSDKA